MVTGSKKAARELTDILAPFYTRHSYFYVRTLKRVSTTIGEKVLIIAFSILLHLYK